MNLLVISRREIPDFIKLYFQKNNIKIFYSRGPLNCQTILGKKNIHYIIIFFDHNIKKIFNDLLLVIQDKSIPIITFSSEQSFFSQKKMKQHLEHISLQQKQSDILDLLSANLQYLQKGTLDKNFSNLTFKNFFKKNQQKISPPNSLFPLSASLDVSSEEKDALLEGNTVKKNIK